MALHSTEDVPFRSAENHLDSWCRPLKRRYDPPTVSANKPVVATRDIKPTSLHPCQTAAVARGVFSIDSESFSRVGALLSCRLDPDPMATSSASGFGATSR